MKQQAQQKKNKLQELLEHLIQQDNQLQLNRLKEQQNSTKDNKRSTSINFRSAKKQVESIDTKYSTTKSFFQSNSQSAKKEMRSQTPNMNLKMSTRFVMRSQQIKEENPMLLNYMESQILENLEKTNNPMIWNQINHQLKVKNQIDLDKLPNSLKFKQQINSNIPDQTLTRLYYARVQETNLRQSDINEKKIKERYLKCSTREIFDINHFDLRLWSTLEIADIIATNKQFKYYILANNEMNKNELKLILNALTKNNIIIHLDHTENNMEINDTSTLMKAIQKHPSIVSLDISNISGGYSNRIGIPGSQAINQMLQFNKILQYLKLNYCGLESQHMDIIVNGLVDNHSLVYLSCNGNRIKNFNILELNKSVLMELDVSNNQLIDEFLYQIIEKYQFNVNINKKVAIFQSLRVLNLGQNQFQQCLGDLFQSLRFENILNKLIINDNKISLTQLNKLSYFIEQNKYIQILNLSNSRINFDGIKFLVDGLKENESLIDLNLNNNPITDPGVELIFQSLQYNLNKDPPKKDDTPKKTIPLQKIHLQFTKSEQKAIYEFSRYILQPNVQLFYIDFSHNLIDDSAYRIILDTCILNTKITTIKLNNNKLSQEKINSIQQQIQKNQSSNKQLLSDQMKKKKQSLGYEIKNLGEQNLTRDQVEIRHNEIIIQNLKIEIEQQKQIIQPYSQIKPSDNQQIFDDLLKQEKDLEKYQNKITKKFQEQCQYFEIQKRDIIQYQNTLDSFNKKSQQAIQQKIKLRDMVQNQSQDFITTLTTNYQNLSQIYQQLENLQDAYQKVIIYLNRSVDDAKNTDISKYIQIIEDYEKQQLELKQKKNQKTQQNHQETRKRPKTLGARPINL